MPNIAKSTCRKLVEELRRPTLDAIKINRGTESARNAPLETLADSSTQFPPKSPILCQLNDSDTQMQTIQFYISEAYPVLILRRIVYAISLQPVLLH